MGNFIKVMNIKEVPKDSMKTVNVSGKQIAICNVNGEFFAIDDTCTHKECSLSQEGFLEDATITCGCHGAIFDATTGQVLSLPATSNLKSYKTKMEGEDLYIEM